jgi:hypothetical protein
MKLPLTTVPAFIFLVLLSCQSLDRIWLDTNADQITVRVNQKPILTYHIATQYPADSLPDYYQRSGFIHPLYSPNGKVLTDGFPEGHTHQHGLFFAFVNTTYRGAFTDFWNQQKETGTVRHKSILAQTEEETGAGFRSVQEHLAIQNGDTLVVLEESWDIQVRTLPGAYLTDLQSTLTVVGTDTLHVNKYHYGGLGFRGSAEWNDLSFKQPKEGGVNYIGKAGKGGFLTSEGKDRLDGNHSHERWVSFHGQVEGDSAGVVILSHPSNFRAPQAVRLHPTMPYFCFSPMLDGAFDLVPGEQFVSRYRILTHDGPPDVAWIEEQWKEYIQ